MAIDEELKRIKVIIWCQVIIWCLERVKKWILRSCEWR